MKRSHKMYSATKKYYQRYTPRPAKEISRALTKKIIYFYRFLSILVISRTSKRELKIILGAALTNQAGWLSTNEEYLDISIREDWERILPRKSMIKRMVAEHVFEHLTKEEMLRAISLCHEYLIPGGTLLIAVPDGNHPDEEYRLHTGINGIGPDARDHKQFIKYEELEKAAKESDFQSCEQIEGYNSNGRLTKRELDSSEFGHIARSRNNNNKPPEDWNFIDAQTSLIALLRK